MMLAAGVIASFVKMLWSLAIVLAIIAVAYAVMRQRASHVGRPSGRSGRGAGRPGAGRLGAGRPGAGRPGAGRSPQQPSRRGARASRRSGRQSIQVLGRVGLTRSSSAVALRFGDRVVLVGASEQSQPTVLAELDVATWELYDADAEWTVPADVDDEDGAPGRPTFIDALREATVRRV